jgi:hypothetical protein
MKLILKDIPRLDSLYEGGEPQDFYDKRRVSKEEDSYVLQGLDEDITSIDNWKKWGSIVNNDYLQTRGYIIDICDWSNLTDAEKDIVIECFAYDNSLDQATNDSNKVTYLMGKGMSQIEAEAFLIQSFAEYRVHEKASCLARATSKQRDITVLTYLSSMDAKDFLETSKTLLELYKSEGVIGSEYGFVGVGVMDYIESTTGTVYENVGLASKGYTINGGAPIQMLIDGVKDIFVNGNY